MKKCKESMLSFKDKVDLARSKYYPGSWMSQQQYYNLPPSQWPLYIVRWRTTEEFELARLAKPKFAKVKYIFKGSYPMTSFGESNVNQKHQRAKKVTDLTLDDIIKN